MSSGEGELRPTTHTTEITAVTAERYRVKEDLKDVEGIILDAARGSTMQLAGLTDADTRDDLAVNPQHWSRSELPAPQQPPTYTAREAHRPMQSTARGTVSSVGKRKRLVDDKTQTATTAWCTAAARITSR
jgi:hypothetical protein